MQEEETGEGPLSPLLPLPENLPADQLGETQEQASPGQEVGEDQLGETQEQASPGQEVGETQEEAVAAWEDPSPEV